MFPLGHLGLGLQTARPLRRGLPTRPLLLGCVLPDLIDKPLYYGLSWSTGKTGAALGLISGTRTFGHTGLLALIVAGTAAARKSKPFAALALGMATHLLLDIVSDALTRGAGFSMRAFLWPLMGWSFPAYTYTGFGEHIRRVYDPLMLICETIGGALLALEWRRSR